MLGLLSKQETPVSAVGHVNIKMDGIREIDYIVPSIENVDMVFMEDSMKYLTLEQDKFMRQYLTAAGIANDKLDLEDENPFSDMCYVLVQFDEALSKFGLEEELEHE